MSNHKVVLLLGSNLGNRKFNIEKAISLIETKAGAVLTKSELLETEPVEFASSEIFCNIALLINTQFSPVKLLKLLKGIEAEMGRTEDSSAVGKYTDRIIDIDIVTFDHINFQSGFLEIPHRKHLFEREFSEILLKDLTQKLNI